MDFNGALVRYTVFVKNASLAERKKISSQERKYLLNLMNGDVFYRLSIWPAWARRMFWKKPLEDADTFKLALFLYGNGCPSFITMKWIVASQIWSGKVYKRINQIKYIFSNWHNKKSEWFYFDLHWQKVLYLDGKSRKTQPGVTHTAKKLNPKNRFFRSHQM